MLNCTVQISNITAAYFILLDFNGNKWNSTDNSIDRISWHHKVFTYCVLTAFTWLCCVARATYLGVWVEATGLIPLVALLPFGDLLFSIIPTITIGFQPGIKCTIAEEKKKTSNRRYAVPRSLLIYALLDNWCNVISYIDLDLFRQLCTVEPIVGVTADPLKRGWILLCWSANF